MKDTERLNRTKELVNYYKAAFDYITTRHQVLEIVEEELEKVNNRSENALLDNETFTKCLSSELDSIVLRKFSVRATSDKDTIKLSYADSLIPKNDNLVACIIKISTVFNASRVAVISFKNEDGTFSEMTTVSRQRKFHPFVEIIADRMQNKLNARKEKYSTQCCDTWKGLDRTALLKHFDEECLEFKSEIFKFIADYTRNSTFEEIDRALDELADVANIGFMLVDNIMNNNKPVLPSDISVAICPICKREVELPLMIKGMCYRCYKLENLK